jgi:GNAT superfamily N-acetyltransferase
MVDVRLGEPADVPALAATLADAHTDYEWARWAFPGHPSERRRRLLGLMSLTLEATVPHGLVWTTDDRACVAVWVPPPPRSPDPDAAARAASEAELLADDGPRLDAADAVTRPFHPTEPSWYLGTIGTLPGRRGEGLATAVLAPVLALCDAERTLAFLETSNALNERLYERLGFVVTHRAVSPDGVLPLTVMVRTPR